jgi:two-component system NtrC family response regulator
MPDGNGLDYLPSLREASSSPEVIIITGAGDPDGAELAIKSGAWDYVQKGATSIKDMMLPLTRAMEYIKEKRTKRPPIVLKRAGIAGDSRAIRECLDLVSQAASSQTSVLLTGETGTGKELFARAIHENSSRASKSMVVVDCTALPDTLVEGLLFGHEKGAFTGADKTQEGLIQQADGGTLFLDEIGELPLTVQKTFLRVFAGTPFSTDGGQKERESDFRLVAATNRDLEQMVREGQFRQDLLYRLKAFSIELPPLREHRRTFRKWPCFTWPNSANGTAKGPRACRRASWMP